MTEQELIDKAYEIMEREKLRPAAERFQRLIDIGLIDEQGRVRDDVRFWHAYLAVVAVKPGSNGKKIEHFRCLKPAFGLPGSATIDVRRESLANYVREGKRIITAYEHEELGWKEGEDVHLTSQGYLRTDANEIDEDKLGDLPGFRTVQSASAPMRSAATWILIGMTSFFALLSFLMRRHQSLIIELVSMR